MIIGWVDAKGRVYDINDPVAPQLLGMPPAILNDMVKHEAEDTRHSGTNLTVTGPVGCARQLGITRMLPAVVDPQILWTTVGGNYLHENFGRLHAGLTDSHGNLIWYTEELHPEKTTFSGTIAGRKISAKMDLVTRNVFNPEAPGIYGDDDYRKAIWDWKTSMNKAQSFAGKEKMGSQWVFTGKAKEAYIAQLNLGRMLMEQNIGPVEDLDMVAWICSGKWVYTDVPPMSIDEIWKLKPGGKVYTYGYMFDEVAKMFDAWEEAAIPYDNDIYQVPIEKRIEILRAMPLYGLNLFNNRYGGNCCTDYCPVKWQCDEVEGGV